LAWTPDGARSGYGQIVIIQMMADGRRTEEQDRALALCRHANLIPLCAKLEAIRASRDQNDQMYESCATRFASAESFAQVESSECDRAFIAMNQGYCAYFQGRPEEASDLLQSAVNGLQKNGELFHQYRSRQLLALAALDCGQISIAEPALDSLLEGVRAARFLPMLAPTYNAEGRLAYHQNRYKDALEWFTFSYEDWRERRVQWLLTEQLYWLGLTYLAMGDLNQAESFLIRALLNWSDFMSPTAAGIALFGLARLSYIRGELQRAADVLEVSAQSMRDRGSLILASEREKYNSLLADLALKGVTPSEIPGITFDSIIANCRASGRINS
jgi:tetratricopeptide (TPR) repeat protein